MKPDTISEWRRLFRKYHRQGNGFWWSLKASWQLERAGRRLRYPDQPFAARSDE